MPKTSAFTTDELLDKALHQFWVNGYHALSIDDLIKATGLSRHGIYTSFGGKKQLFLACFDRYQDQVVTPAFSVVEASGASLQSIAVYFGYQITRGEAAGLPGPGCFVANSSTEVAPHDDDVMSKVNEHNQRLYNGFYQAISNELAGNAQFTPQTAQELAQIAVTFTNGLWSMSRTVTDAELLRLSVMRFLNMIASAGQ